MVFHFVGQYRARMNLSSSMRLSGQVISHFHISINIWKTQFTFPYHCLVEPLCTCFLPSKINKQTSINTVRIKTPSLKGHISQSWYPRDSPWISATAMHFRTVVFSKFIKGTVGYWGSEPLKERLVLFWVLSLSPLTFCEAQAHCWGWPGGRLWSSWLGLKHRSMWGPRLNCAIISLQCY